MYYPQHNLLFTLAAYACFMPAATRAQSLTAAESQLLDSRENSRTLPCEVSLNKPSLDLDLRFHAAFAAMVKPEGLAGGAVALQSVTRVIPNVRPAHIFLLRDSVPLPKLPAGSNFDVNVLSPFTLGPGSYHLDFVLYDADGNACSSHKDVKAKVPNQLKSFPLGMTPNTAEIARNEPFAQPPAVLRKNPHPLSVKVLVSFSTGDPARASVEADDIRAVTSILRILLREPRFGRYSVTLFSVEQERVLYQSGFQPHIDFGALRNAVRSVRLGTIDYHQLQDRESTRRFLARLFVDNLGAGSASADAVVIVSPRLNLNAKLSREALETAGRTPCPVFYLDYAPDPTANPWLDPIGTAVKMYEGLHYSISAPKDLGKAFGDMMSRLAPR